MITFHVPFPPVAQPRQGHKAFVTSAGRVGSANYTPKKHKVNAFKLAVQLAFKAEKRGFFSGPVAVAMTFIFPRPKRLGKQAKLAWHIANSDIQFLDGIADLKFNMATPAEADKPKTSAELVAWYDQNFKRAAARVRALSPEQLLTPIDFYGVFNLPAAFYLGFLNNHSIHHRGQLATYLRPMGSKCPSIYGGSYDEPWQPADAETTAA